MVSSPSLRAKNILQEPLALKDYFIRNEKDIISPSI